MGKILLVASMCLPARETLLAGGGKGDGCRMALPMGWLDPGKASEKALDVLANPFAGRDRAMHEACFGLCPDLRFDFYGNEREEVDMAISGQSPVYEVSCAIAERRGDGGPANFEAALRKIAQLALASMKGRLRGEQGVEWLDWRGRPAIGPVLMPGKEAGWPGYAGECAALAQRILVEEYAAAPAGPGGLRRSL